MEKVLESRGLDTLAVGPVTLVNGEPTGGVQYVDGFAKTSRIFVGAVALWTSDGAQRVVTFKQRTEMIGSV